MISPQVFFLWRRLNPSPGLTGQVLGGSRVPAMDALHTQVQGE